MKLMIHKSLIFYAISQSVFLRIFIKQSLYSDLKLVLIHVIDKINKYIFRPAPIQGRDQKQDACHPLILFSPAGFHI